MSIRNTTQNQNKIIYYNLAKDIESQYIVLYRYLLNRFIHNH